jgi:hypothetical protein
MPLPPETPPTPMPGAKPSGGGKGTDPRAATDKATDAEQSAANLTPAERAHAETHVSVLQKLLGQPQAPGGKDTGNQAQKSVNDAVDEAVKTAPGNSADY